MKHLLLFHLGIQIYADFNIECNQYDTMQDFEIDTYEDVKQKAISDLTSGIIIDGVTKC